MNKKDFLQAISDAIEELDDKSIRQIKLEMESSREECKPHHYNRLNMVAYDDRD